MEIEKLATAAITTYISKTDCLSPFINEGDKEPFWDGNIYIYKDRQKRKEDFIGKISVQVKGKYAAKFTNKPSQKYHVDISDLKSYSLCGTIYFVVFIDNNMDTHIYYNLFYPIDIKRILSRVGRQKGTNIEFNKLPPHSDITPILLNFSDNCDKQISFAKQPNFKVLNIEDITNSQQTVEINVTHSDNCISNIVDYILSNDVFLYTKAPLQGYPDIPIDKVFIQKIGKTINETVTINNILFYENFTMQRTKKQTILTFGDCIVFDIYDLDKCKLNINLNGNIVNQITALNFIIELSVNLKLKLGDYEFCLGRDNNIDVDKCKKQLSYLQNIRYVLNALDVRETLNIDYDKFNNEFKSALEILIKVIVYKQPYNNNKWNNVQRVKMQIFDIYLPLIFIKGKKGESDRFINELTQSTDITLHYKSGKVVSAPQCILLEQEDFELISSQYYDWVLHSLTNNGTDEVLIDRINMILLSILLAYDITEKKGLLDLAIHLSEWLLENGNNIPLEIRQINNIQAKKRNYPLDDSEVKILKSIASNREEAETLTAVYLLLDDIEKAKHYYKLIRDKKNYKKYPIYAFMNKKNSFC